MLEKKSERGSEAAASSPPTTSASITATTRRLSTSTSTAVAGLHDWADGRGGFRDQEVGHGADDLMSDGLLRSRDEDGVAGPSREVREEAVSRWVVGGVAAAASEASGVERAVPDGEAVEHVAGVDLLADGGEILEERWPDVEVRVDVDCPRHHFLAACDRDAHACERDSFAEVGHEGVRVLGRQSG